MGVGVYRWFIAITFVPSQEEQCASHLYMVSGQREWSISVWWIRTYITMVIPSLPSRLIH